MLEPLGVVIKTITVKTNNDRLTNIQKDAFNIYMHFSLIDWFYTLVKCSLLVWKTMANFLYIFFRAYRYNNISFYIWKMNLFYLC